MELALNWALKKMPEKIRIFGATGGRLIICLEIFNY